jgi:hypothetical protein
MAETITFQATGNTETITFTAVESSETITVTLNEQARGPAGPAGSGGGGGGREVKSASFTAANDTDYSIVANATVTDPSPTEGKGYSVLVRNGTATIAGVAYSLAGTLIQRVFHSGAWATYSYSQVGHTHVSADITDASSSGEANALARFDAEGGLSAQYLGTIGQIRGYDAGGVTEYPWTIEADGVLTEQRFYTLPDNDGTFALVGQDDGSIAVADISDLADTVLTLSGTQIITGNKEFAGSTTTTFGGGSVLFTDSTASFGSAGGGLAFASGASITFENGSIFNYIGDAAATHRAALGAQATLVSGTNIKTVNSQSILGIGDLTVSASFANPTASIGLTAVNGSASTAMRSDAAPALDQAIAPTWTAAHTWSQSIAAGETATAQTLINTGAASLGNQRHSPATVKTGEGWGSGGTGRTAISFQDFVQPIQGTTARGAWILQSQIGTGGTWTTVARIGTDSASSILIGTAMRINGNFPDSIGFGSSAYASVFAVGSNGRTVLASPATLGWMSSTSGTQGDVVADTMLGRQAAANLRQGAADAAAPVAQTSSVQSVVAGTSNTAGANRTYSGSQGTGTGLGGNHTFTVATAGSSGTSQNSQQTALRIEQDRSVFVANASAEPATPSGGGVFYVQDGALKYKGSSGTVTTIANA